MNPETAVIVLTHNQLACTRKCLTQLLRSRARTWELIAVDNGSSDGTREWLEGFRETAAASGVGMRLIANNTNPGCSTARNQGAARAAKTVRRLVFIDNDATVRTRGWIDALADELDARPDVGMIGPKLVYPFAPYPIQCAGCDVTRGGRVVFRGRGEPRAHPDFNTSRNVPCLISACCMLRRDAFEQAGGFDEWFNPVEYEDIDLSYRLRENGRSILYLPSVEMYHFENITTRGTEKLPNTYLIVRNGMRFKRRWRHFFESENGPPDAAARWRRIEVPPFESIPPPPLTD